MTSVTFSGLVKMRPDRDRFSRGHNGTGIQKDPSGHGTMPGAQT